MSPLNNSEIKGSDYYYDNNYTGADIIHRQTDTYIHTQMKLMNIVQKKSERKLFEMHAYCLLCCILKI